MCTKAAQTAASLLKAIEPSLTSLLEYLGLTNTPDGEAVITSYNAAVAALDSWQSGTVAQNVLQLIGDFQTVFNTLPLPATVLSLTNIILAGVEAVIGVITANSPAPAAPASSTAEPELTQALFQAHVAKQTEANVTALVPSFKRSLFHSAAHQYQSTWNKEVETKGFPSSMKI